MTKKERRAAVREILERNGCSNTALVHGLIKDLLERDERFTVRELLGWWRRSTGSYFNPDRAAAELETVL